MALVGNAIAVTFKRQMANTFYVVTPSAEYVASTPQHVLWSAGNKTRTGFQLAAVDSTSGSVVEINITVQSVGVTEGYYLFNAAPYILTLLIMIITCTPKRSLIGAPGELSITR